MFQKVGEGLEKNLPKKLLKTINPWFLRTLRDKLDQVERSLADDRETWRQSYARKFSRDSSRIASLVEGDRYPTLDA